MSFVEFLLLSVGIFFMTLIGGVCVFITSNVVLFVWHFCDAITRPRKPRKDEEE